MKEKCLRQLFKFENYVFAFLQLYLISCLLLIDLLSMFDLKASHSLSFSSVFPKIFSYFLSRDRGDDT